MGRPRVKRHFEWNEPEVLSVKVRIWRILRENGSLMLCLLVPYLVVYALDRTPASLPVGILICAGIPAAIAGLALLTLNTPRSVIVTEEFILSRGGIFNYKKLRYCSFTKERVAGVALCVNEKRVAEDQL